MLQTQSIKCPAARCKTGSELLGVRQNDGTVAILPVPLQIDKHFMETASRHGKPEEQFRFTNKCIEGGCKQWNGNGCSVANRVVQFMDTIHYNADLPACAIRPQCRWHLQQGDDACRMCPYVVTEITEEETEKFYQEYDHL